MHASRFDRLTRLFAQRTSRRRAGRVLGSLAAAGALGSTLASQSALAVRQSSAACPDDLAGRSSFGPQHGFAQTFTPTVGGKISRVQFLVSHSVQATKDYVIKIVPVDSSGTPIGTRTLAKKVIPTAQLLGGDQFLIAKFKKRKATIVRTDKAYAIFLQGDPAELRVIARSGDPCDGEAFTYDQNTGTFLPATGTDFVFEVFVGYG